MAPRDPNRPQLDFPVLVADVIRELRLTGQVGLLDFSDVVQPVYIVASRGGALDVVASAPIYASASLVSGTNFSPAVNTLLLDTGPLPAGTYDLYGSISFNGIMNIQGNVEVQHRDAANAATIVRLLNLGITTTHHASFASFPPIGYTIAENERIRFMVLVGAVTGTVTSTLGFLLRSTP